MLTGSILTTENAVLGCHENIWTPPPKKKNSLRAEKDKYTKVWSGNLKINFNIILTYRLSLPCDFFSYLIPVYISLLICAAHLTFLDFIIIISGEAPHYATFSSPLLLPVCWVQVSLPCPVLSRPLPKYSGSWRREVQQIARLCLTQVYRWRHSVSDVVEYITEKVTRIYFQHTSCIHTPVGNSNTLGLYWMIISYFEAFFFKERMNISDSLHKMRISLRMSFSHYKQNTCVSQI
jgi:hypothetical protein